MTMGICSIEGIGDGDGKRSKGGSWEKEVDKGNDF